jgi:uncharacterized protein
MQPLNDEVRIPVRDAVLAGTLVAPADRVAHPCLLLVSGSGANDRNETVCGHTPFKTIAEYFLARGYAVLRCDDRGVGASTGDAGEQDFDGAVADLVAAYRWLAQHAVVDPERITLLGHSEGGLVAAAAAPQLGARSVVLLAAPSVPIEELLHQQARAISVEGGATSAQLEHERQMNMQVFALARSKGRTEVILRELEELIATYLRRWPDAPEPDAELVRDNARLMARVVGAPAYRSLLRQDPKAILARCSRPLLAIYGGKDTQVPGAANTAAFRAITTHHACDRALVFPHHNHLFQLAKTGSIREYETLQTGPDEPVLQAVADWLLAAKSSS